MTNFNRKISTNDTLIQMINKFNLLVDHADMIDNRINTIHTMVIDQQKNKTQHDENEKENSEDRFNLLMECAYEIRKTCSDSIDCDDCPFYNRQCCVCMITGIRPDRWILEQR